MKSHGRAYTKSKYNPSQPNKSLLLHKGQIILTQDSTELQGYGEIKLAWLPRPHLSFKADFGSEQSSEVRKLDLRTTIKIQLPDLGENFGHNFESRFR
jgi:hypothetical protein